MKNKNLPTFIHLFIIYSSFFIAFILTTVPWSNEYIAYKPYWVLVVLIYWVRAAPKYVSYISALIVGILMDSLYNLNLGHHSIGYIIVVFLLHRISFVIKEGVVFFSFILVGFVITIFTLVFNALDYGRFLLSADSNYSHWYGPIIVSTFIWLWLSIALDILQKWIYNKTNRSFISN